jgi:hypothetical protein
MTRRFRPFQRWLLIGACVLIPGVMAGCAAFGFVAKAVSDSTPVPKVHALAEQTTVVFVDDPDHVLPNLTVGSTIAQRITADLQAGKAVARLVPPTKIDELRAAEPGFGKLPVDEVGRRVGADQVVYVQINSFTLGVEDGAFRPLAEAEVKVIDAVKRARVFPTGQRGHTVTHQLNYRHESADTRGHTHVLTRQVAERLGRDVAFLFYDHPRPETDVSVQPPR